MKETTLIAKTFAGLEEVLAGELVELGANNVQMGRRMVSFTGDKEMLYRANFCLRTAVRVLKPVMTFRAGSPDEIYAAVTKHPWEEVIMQGKTFSVDAVTSGEEFPNSRFVTYRVKDAIVDRFRERGEKRPSISVSNPDIRLNIHAAEGLCTLSLDSSGESLHLRGYRVASVEAPLNEVLAAGMILLSGWKGDTDFYDPFCGSGTLLVEAALIAKGIAPGLFRKKFAFENWPDFDPDLLSRIYEDDSLERDFAHHIYGFDRDIAAVKAAERNAKSAGVSDVITVEERDISSFVQPAEPGIMVTNPPYGDRLPSQGLLDLYATLGERLKNAFTGGTAWVISSREELLRKIGMRHSVRYQLFNGKLDCDLRKYQVFDGKLKDFRAEGGEMKNEEELRHMADRKSFRARRDDFKQRVEDREDFADAQFLEENPDFLALRNRHHEFDRYQRNKARREARLKFEAEQAERASRPSGDGTPAPYERVRGRYERRDDYRGGQERRDNPYRNPDKPFRKPYKNGNHKD
ncbi:MAG: RNA methyltransferase [Bacteroidaceae bacterium]|nr:RNA methyltransferase [Bacteroidaceae bacterium]